MKETPEAPSVPLLLYMTSAMFVWVAYFIGVDAFASIACMYGLDNAHPFGIPFLLLSVGALAPPPSSRWLPATILSAAFLRHGGRARERRLRKLCRFHSHDAGDPGLARDWLERDSRAASAQLHIVSAPLRARRSSSAPVIVRLLPGLG